MVETHSLGYMLDIVAKHVPLETYDLCVCLFTVVNVGVGCCLLISTPIDFGQFVSHHFAISPGHQRFRSNASQAVLGVEKRQRLQRQLLQPAEGRCRSAEAVVEVAPCDAGGSMVDPWRMAMVCGKNGWFVLILNGWYWIYWLIVNHHEIIMSLFQWNWMLGRFVDERMNCRIVWWQTCPRLRMVEGPIRCRYLIADMTWKHSCLILQKYTLQGIGSQSTISSIKILQVCSNLLQVTLNWPSQNSSRKYLSHSLNHPQSSYSASWIQSFFHHNPYPIICYEVMIWYGLYDMKSAFQHMFKPRPIFLTLPTFQVFSNPPGPSRSSRPSSARCVATGDFAR